MSLSRPKNTAADFLRRSRELIYGIQLDDFVKTRLAAYNVTEERLAEHAAVYTAAAQAEHNIQKELGEQLEAGEAAEKFRRELLENTFAHMELLKLALQDDRDKYKKVFTGLLPRPTRVFERYKYTIGLYQRVLDDTEILDKVAGFGVTRENLETTMQMIYDAQTAKESHHREMGERQDARHQRDLAFDELNKTVNELKTLLRLSLKDRPQLMEKFGVHVPSSKPRRKTSGEEEPPVVDPPQEDPGETPDTAPPTVMGEAGEEKETDMPNE